MLKKVILYKILDDHVDVGLDTTNGDISHPDG